MTDQNNAAHDLGTSSGGRAYIADYFATELRRHDFARYINSTLAADFACVLAQHLSKLRAEGVQADEPVADAVVRQCPRCTGNGTILRLSGNGPNAYDVQEECSHCEGSGVVASAPVAGEAVAIPLRPLTEDERAAIEFYILNPTAAVRDLDKRLSGHAAPQANEAVRILFPAHLRKMWSGGEIQGWLDQHQGKTPPPGPAKGSLERYRQWKVEQAPACAPCTCPSGDGSLRHQCAEHPPVKNSKKEM